MDPNTGHLVSNINDLPEDVREKYKRLTGLLADEARDALAGERETYINLNARTNLAKWAANQRKKQRTRNKLAKKSRARNRKP